MTEHGFPGRELAKGAGRFVGHTAATVVGFVLMIAGIALGVSLVLLPFGIPLGLVGLLIFLWGLFGRSPENQAPPQPPGQPQV
jgi:hypothetical protein